MYIDVNAESRDLPGQFQTVEGVRQNIMKACAARPDVASFHQIGTSEEGRPIDAVALGTGAHRISLLAGAHADEPVGPETLRFLTLKLLNGSEGSARVLEKFRFVIIPQINPDGEARNRPWTERRPDVETYLKHVVRDPPGRDLEFGFPAMRPENEAVSRCLSRHAPYRLHMSLHGMAFSEGALLLIERGWVDRTKRLREEFKAMVSDAGLRLHDHDRGGEKGFEYLGPGFTTTPRGEAMQRYFQENGDPDTASLFHLSSMEFVRGLGGDPLCLVTEFPLFLVAHPDIQSERGRPAAYLAFKERLPEIRLGLERGIELDKILGDFVVRPMSLQQSIALQVHVIEMGLEVI